jgi:hypothetical protein
MALLEDENVLFETVNEGVRSGLIGIREGLEVYHKQGVSPTIDSVILRGEVAKKMKEAEIEVKEEVPETKVEMLTEKEGVKRLSLRAKIPWDKLSYVISGVIRPLKDKGLSPEITIEIKAKAEEMFDRTTLDTKVRETLKQIGAEIEDWKEE